MRGRGHIDPEWVVQRIQQEMQRQREADREVRRRVAVQALVVFAFLAVLAAALNLYGETPLTVRVPLAVATALGSAAALLALFRR